MELTTETARMCPKCGNDSRVYWTYDRNDGARMRRVRCPSCGTVFETIEVKTRIVKNLQRPNIGGT